MKKSSKFNLKFSICMPVYNGSSVISETLKSILSQSFDNFEIIINDDCSKDNTEEVIKSFKDKRIKFFKNKKNLGYPMNLESCRRKAKGDIIYLMGQDDILGKDVLLKTYRAFESSAEIGAVTRPYYWFDKDIDTPVRAKKQLNPKKNVVLDINESSLENILIMFSTLDQLSGLAYRKEYIDIPFHPDVFPCHVYPFASIFKKHKVVFLKDYSIAVRIGSSQARSSSIYQKKTSYIYDKSPLQSWVEMFEGVYFEDEFKDFKNWMIKNFVATNYVGLVQIKNYAKFSYLIREIILLIKYRWQNLYSPIFWAFSLGCIVIPHFFLIPLVDWYKNTIMSRGLQDIKFDYEL